MSGWVLLIIAVILVVTLRAVAANVLPKLAIPIWVKIVLVVLLLFGGFLTIYSVNKVNEAFGHRDWTEIEATVINSDVQSNGVVRPLVYYAYVVDGQAQVDTTYLNYPGFGNRPRQLEVADKLSKEFPTGKKIKAFYNPDNITESVISLSPTWDVYGKLGLGMTLFLVSLFFLLLPKPVETKQQN